MRVRLLAAALLSLAAALAAVAGGREAPAGAANGQPNIVLITTDDQTAASLEVMKRTRALLADRGASFERYFASYPLCCPARTTWLTGQYAHNHGVIDNAERNGGGYANLRDPERVLPVWLRAAGYETALVGKWVHGYGSLEPPPGWDHWWGLVPATATSYYDYDVADSNGGLVRYGDATGDYQTDVFTHAYAVPFIQARAAAAEPFFLHLSYTAPHWGLGRDDRAGRRCASGQPFSFETARPKPAERHADAFRRRAFPQPPSFDEADVSDKPAEVRRRGRIDRAERREIVGRYRCELASLLAVDEGVAAVDDALQAAGIAEETVVIYTSDNGYMHGEHRILAEKVQPYEEAIRVPLLIRGPGIAPGTRVRDPVADVDLVPTILELAGVAQPPGGERAMDGRSLLPYAGGERARSRAILLEAKRPPRAGRGGRAVAASWVGVRTRRYTYVERHELELGSVEEGFGQAIGAGPVIDRELYDNRADPHQLENLTEDPELRALRRALADALERLRACAGPACAVDVAASRPRSR